MAFGDFTVVRSTVKNVRNSSGVLAEVAINTPAFEFNADGSYKGLIPETEATNLALHSRDLTNAVWTASDVTTAKTATGADGVTNGATTLTATDANGTVLQSITSASSERVFSAFVRRRTGAGVVEMTQDNGSTYTAITLTGTYNKFTVLAQTTVDPIVGFRIVTSGDAIDVDATQAETGSDATSPIYTGASAVTRGEDDISLAGASSLIGQSSGSVGFTFVAPAGYKLFMSGLSATVSGVTKVRFFYSTTEVSLHINDVLVQTKTGTYSWSTMDDIELGHYEGLSQVNTNIQLLFLTA